MCQDERLHPRHFSVRVLSPSCHCQTSLAVHFSETLRVGGRLTGILENTHHAVCGLAVKAWHQPGPVAAAAEWSTA
ncbi:hypothetical protein Q5P01_018665 [Channa striata]|uniref:Uncharacterized protein n=1 Tax=Channa striata TaxID=64152 RepID=A0AA88M5C1_CHASR|nr:hypothetical protein Q5P01_018665 [Channa striata]